MSAKPDAAKLQSVVPYLGVKGAAAAIEFYKKAFGAKETMGRITDGEGRVGHAELEIGGSEVYLADEHPEHGLVGPESLGGTPVMFMLRVPDVDAVVQRAVAAGGKLTRPVANQFYGERTGEVTDPFGHRWTLSTHVEDVSEAEMQKRAKELYG